MTKKTLFLFVALSVLASAVNYLVYPLFGRILAPSEYIHITVSLSLFTQISTFLSSIVAITIGLSKDSEDKSTDRTIEQLQAFLFKLFLVLATFFLVLSPLIMRSAHTPVLFALPIALMMLFSIPILTVTGYLNGKGKMVKLGLVTVLAATTQAVVGLTVALVSRSGFATILAMSLAQILSLTAIYYFLRHEQVPRIFGALRAETKIGSDKNLRRLVVYTAFSALSVMAISLTQIADLFIVQDLTHADVKFYTDIYIISRIVFFAGTIFIWPFLSEISLDHHHFNRKPFAKLLGYFTAICFGTLLLLFLFGSQLTGLLFGAKYSAGTVWHIGLLSVLYKFFLLVITAVVLYFVVLHRYTAVWFAILVSGTVLAFSQLMPSTTSVSSMLLWLDCIVGILAAAGVFLLFSVPIRKTKNR